MFDQTVTGVPMFKKPRDSLKEYLRAHQPRREEALRVQFGRRLGPVWQWANRHQESSTRLGITALLWLMRFLCAIGRICGWPPLWRYS